MSKKTVVPNEVWQDSRLNDRKRRVLGVLYSFKGKGDEVWPTREKIAERCGGLDVDIISKTTTELMKLGWLSKKGKGGKSRAAHYRLHVPQCLESGQQTLSAAKGVTAKQTLSAAKGVTAKQTLSAAKGVTAKQTPSQTEGQTLSELRGGKELTNELTIQAADAACSACAQPPAPACTHEPEPETASAQNAEPEFALQPDAPKVKPITQRQARLRGTFVTAQRPPEVSERVWADWITHRRGLRNPVPITDASMSITLAEAKKAGITVEQALIYAMQFGWRNYDFNYHQNRIQREQGDGGGFKTGRERDLERARREHKEMYGEWWGEWDTHKSADGAQQLGCERDSRTVDVQATLRQE